MSVAKIRQRIREQPRQTPAVEGLWRPISLCIDEDAGEFFNVGVMFSGKAGQFEVRMMDYFDRLKCLFDNRVDPNDMQRLLVDIEAGLYELHGDVPDQLGSTIRLGQALYAAGASPADVIDTFFDDVVTLGRPRAHHESSRFRYQSTPKLKVSVLDIMKQRLHMQASRVIQEERHQLKLRTGHHIEVDVPLLSSTSAGSIVSAWYKSPLVVENNLLQASADLNLIRSNSDRSAASLSVLIPDAESGLSKSEFNKLDTTTRRQIEKIRATGIEVLEAGDAGALADRTVDWWRNRCA